MTNGLAHESIGGGTRVVVFSHGFTQTRAMWRPIAHELCKRDESLRCVLVDLPGHGESAHITTPIEEAARLLVATGGGAVYVGYSLGARVALRALVDHPAIVQGVISISGTAGLETESERQARVTADETLARRLEAIGVGAFLDEWLAQPLFADLPRDQAGLPDRLGNTVAGLAESLRNCGQGRQRPLWDDLRTSTRPLLAIAGSLDLKYVALARRLASTAPHGTLTLITGAGHGAPQAMPLAVVDAVLEWLTSQR
ncbi:MAG: alpha/beta fold hydrolase [Actinomycetota bacterium]